LKAPQNLAEHDLAGDVAFLRGDFAAAEAAYLAAAEKDPTFQLGRLYAKAGEAALLQNQLPRADAHMQRFFGLYQQGVPAGIGIVQGLWLWRTGHRADAVRQAAALPSVKPLFDFLANPAAGGPPPAGPALQALAQGRAAEAAQMMAGFIGQQPLLVGLRWDPVLAVALAEAGKKTEACALLRQWGLPPPPDDWSGAVVWPRQLAVRAECWEQTDPARAKQLRALVANLEPR
jgi:tetratricopeptide (TPR) repeat protein